MTPKERALKHLANFYGFKGKMDINVYRVEREAIDIALKEQAKQYEETLEIIGNKKLLKELRKSIDGYRKESKK